jgi:iron complex transport system substrate-binding protein
MNPRQVRSAASCFLRTTRKVSLVAQPFARGNPTYLTMIQFSHASRYWRLVALLLPAHAAQYPIGITNCGVSSWINGTPSRAVSMNQGATELLLALNLSSRMVGTAYLDDEIWPEVAAKYSEIPVLSATYPTIDELLAVEPDFVFASYSSAFQLGYVNTTSYAGECDLGNPNEDETNSTSTSCRQELNGRGIQAYLQVAACEEAEHRPVDNSPAVVFEEIWEVATIFDALDEARQLVDNIDNYFDLAKELSSRGNADPVKILWLDAWSDDAPSVGACCGSVQTIISHSGAKNIFDDVGLEDKATWAPIPWEDIIPLDPDVIVVIDASWDKAGIVHTLVDFDFARLFIFNTVSIFRRFPPPQSTRSSTCAAIPRPESYAQWRIAPSFRSLLAARR